MTRPGRGHELIEHTADVGLEIWAPTLEELFAEAATALVDVMGTPTATDVRTETVVVEAPDLDALFVDWLSEVLFLFEARQIVPRDVRVSVHEQPWRLEATIEGPSRQGLVEHGPGVKAVTYHGLEIARTESGYTARVYLDV